MSLSPNHHSNEDFFHIYPSGFIFHAGRCGSTQLSKSLARSRNHLVLSEAAPINQLLDLFNKNGGFSNENSKKVFRNLVLSMCRQRAPSFKHSFIKYTSFNICYFDFIHSVFPDVPAIFLTRSIPEIITSFCKSPPGWFKEENDRSNLESIINNFFQHASDIPSNILKHIDYKLLIADNLEQILSNFNITSDKSQLELMKSQFAYYSKVEFNGKLFSKESN